MNLNGGGCSPVRMQVPPERADDFGGMTHARVSRSSCVSAENLMGTNDPGVEAVALLPEGPSRA